jgi:hypothetical protein
MQFRRNASLIAGILIPAAMLLFVAGAAVLPGLMMHPGYDFMYVSGDDHYRAKRGRLPQIQRYKVEQGRLVLSEPEADVAPDYNMPRNPKLYLHDVAKNRSREISDAEAQKLSIDTARVSPDGYSVVQDQPNGLLSLLAPRNRNARYLAGRWLSQQLELETPNAYTQIRVLGWVEHQ